MLLFRTLWSDLRANPGRNLLTAISLFFSVLAVIGIIVVGSIANSVLIATAEQQGGQVPAFGVSVTNPSVPNQTLLDMTSNLPQAEAMNIAVRASGDVLVGKTPGQRIPRRPLDAERVLRRQWDKAVRYVARHPRRAGDDPTFDARAGAIANHVRHLQQAAQSAAGRWSHGGGPADRRILDALCVLALQSLQHVVEADTRRLAELAGIGRETARVALHRLAADGWISRDQEAHGCHGARWSLSTFHNLHEPAWSQADLRAHLPQHTGTAERAAQLQPLLDRLAAAVHDTFTLGAGLGLHAGNVYAAVTPDATTTHDVARAIGTDDRRTQRDLNRLAAAGLIKPTKQGWRRCGRAALDRVAAQRHIAGRLGERRRRHAIERELWAWYQAETEWMRAPRRTQVTHRPRRGQLTLIPDSGTHAYGPHPRRADGTLDWRAARHIVQDERGGSAQRRKPTRPQPIAS